jgi:hypothetical protein
VSVSGGGRILKGGETNIDLPIALEDAATESASTFDRAVGSDGGLTAAIRANDSDSPAVVQLVSESNKETRYATLTEEMRDSEHRISGGRQSGIGSENRLGVDIWNRTPRSAPGLSNPTTTFATSFIRFRLSPQ